MASKLAMSFITYNRAKHIREDLKHIASQTLKKGILIYIFDVSTDEETKKVVNSFIKQGYHHIKYYHYKNDLEGMIQRTKDSMLIPDAEYLWLCGDKFLISPKNYDKILECVDKSFDIITIYDSSLHNTKVFRNPVKYVDYSIIPFTHIGAVIIKKSLVNINEINKAIKISYVFWHVNMYCNIIDKSDFRGITIYVPSKELRIISKYNTESTTKHNMWDVWIEDWYKIIMTLPDRYNKIKRRIIDKPDRDLSFFDLKSLLIQHKEGQFNFKKCIEYRNYISSVINISNIIIFIISLLPKSLAGVLENIM